MLINVNNIAANTCICQRSHGSLASRLEKCRNMFSVGPPQAQVKERYLTEGGGWRSEAPVTNYVPPVDEADGGFSCIMREKSGGRGTPSRWDSERL